MSLALVFPGQGTQHPDMLPWLAGRPEAAAALAELDQALGQGWRDRLRDAAWATRQQVAQPLLTLASLAAWTVLEPLLPAPAAVAGYSVGEVPAWCVAGVYDTAQAVAMAQQRAALMAAAGQQTPSGLMAVAGVDAVQLEAVRREHHVEPAIVLSHDEMVLGGGREDLAAAQARLAGSGVRCTPLAVDVASHTSLLQPTVPAWQQALQPWHFRRPRCPLVCNATAAVEADPQVLRQAAAEQIARTVRWDRCMDTLAERGVRCVLEVGPGTTLSRLWNRRYPAIPARGVDEFRTPERAAGWARSVLERG